MGPAWAQPGPSAELHDSVSNSAVRGGSAGGGRKSLRLARQRGVYRKLLESTLTMEARRKHFPDHVNPRDWQWYTLVGFKEAWKRFVDESYLELPKL